MKKSKILAPALAVLCLSVAASVTGTVAWFSANNVVSATGMKVKSTIPSSLAINSALPVGQATSISLAADAVPLSPCSHWHGEEDATGGLWKVSNTEDVDTSTGLAKSGESLSFDQTGIDAGIYYQDFTVYIGAVGQAINLTSTGYLKATVTFSSESLTATNAATSMDFYAFNGANAASAGLGSFMGTINAASVDPVINHNTTSYTGAVIDTPAVTLISGESTILVSTNETDGLKITMRVYIDGGLLNTDHSTYVANNTAISKDVTMNVNFTLFRGA